MCKDFRKKKKKKKKKGIAGSVLSFYGRDSTSGLYAKESNT